MSDRLYSVEVEGLTRAQANELATKLPDLIGEMGLDERIVTICIWKPPPPPAERIAA